MMHLTVQQLSASLDGALTGPSLELVVRHLAACHECRDRQARLAKHDDALRRLLGQEPDDLFLDDLTRRAEEQVLAISHGMPAPAMSTSVPLIHEEDPYAPVEPPPAPPRPELGRAGELAKEAGWGRIGLKPTASTHAPESNPEEAQRLLEALESGNIDDFTELTAQGLQEHAHIDGPTFDLPAWIKEQSKSPGKKSDTPREVPKLHVFFADLDERAAGLTREAVDEVFRRDEHDPANAGPGANDTPPVTGGTPPTPARPTLSLVPPAGAPGVPPEHVAFAPPGWRPPEREVRADGRPKGDPPREPRHEPRRAAPDPREAQMREAQAREAEFRAAQFEDVPHGMPYDDTPRAPDRDARRDAVYDAAYDAAHDAGHDAGHDVAHDASHAASYFAPHDPGQDRAYPTGVTPEPQHAWSGTGVDLPGHAPADRPVPFEPYTLGAARLRTAHPRKGGDRAGMMAFLSVSGLLLIVLALQLSPPTPAQPKRGDGVRGVQVPHVTLVQRDTPVPPPPEPAAQVESAATPAPVDQAVPASEHAPDATEPTHFDMPAVIPPDTAEPGPARSAGKRAAPAATAVRATPTRPAPKRVTPSSPQPVPAATPSDDVSWPLLCGVVLDAAGRPLAGARVTVTEIAFSMRTDVRGRFCLSAPSGLQHLLVEANGFVESRQSVTLAPNSPELRLQLHTVN